MRTHAPDGNGEAEQAFGLWQRGLEVLLAQNKRKLRQRMASVPTRCLGGVAILNLVVTERLGVVDHDSWWVGLTSSMHLSASSTDRIFQSC